MNNWTQDEAHEALFVVVVGIAFGLMFQPVWYALPGVIIACIISSFGVFAVVGLFTRWLFTQTQGAGLNPFARLGLRGTAPYKAAYAALFKAIRQLEEDAEVRYFNYRNVREIAGYEGGKRKNYEMLACLHAWSDIKPLLEPYSKEDASGTLFVGFIKP